MNEELENDIREQVAQLPPNVRAAIASVGLSEKVAALGRKYRLLIDQQGKLDTEISLSLLGMTRPDQLDEALITEVGLDKEAAYAMVEDINKEIFEPIRQTLMVMQHPESVPVSAPDSTLSKETLLSGIENPASLKTTSTPLQTSAPERPAGAMGAILKPAAAPISSSFTAAKLSGTFAQVLPARPIAAPTLKTMPRSPEEAAKNSVPTLAGDSRLPLVAANQGVRPPAPMAPVPNKPSVPSVAPAAVKPPVSSVAPSAPRTIAPVYSAPLVKTPTPVNAPSAAIPSIGRAAAPQMSTKPGLADAIRSALPNMPVSRGISASPTKPVADLASAVKAVAPTAVPLGREPLPTGAAAARPINPLAGIPPEVTPKTSASTSAPSIPSRSSDPYREPIN